MAYVGLDMAQYRKIQKTIDAYRWCGGEGSYDGEVKAYINSQLEGSVPCGDCGRFMRNHGWILNSEGGHIVCPGDFIVTESDGDRYAYDPDLFKKNYEEILNNDN